MSDSGSASTRTAWSRACVQDWRTGEVLTLAYMNEEALRRTRETREVHFFSRSRQELWRKGETSGNVQRAAPAALRLRRRRARRPGRAGRSRLPHRRALVLLPRPRRHRRPAWTPAARRARAGATRRWRRSSARSRRGARERPEGSYTVELLDDPARIGAKVREEADEVARAAAGESDERVAEEAADVLYHLEVLLLSRERAAGRGAGGAQWPSPLSPARARARPRARARARPRGERDPGRRTGSSTTARPRSRRS